MRLRIERAPAYPVPRVIRAPVPWHGRVAMLVKSLSGRLHTCHPVLASLLHLWDLDLKVGGLTLA